MAIRVLPHDLARDGEGVARFGREAKLPASLNHPKIAALRGFDEFDDTRFLLLECVEEELWPIA